MTNSRAARPFIAIAFTALAGGVACVVWADELGGYRFIGVSVAVVLAMLSLAKMSALRRAEAGVAPVAPKRRAKKAAVAQPRTAAQQRDDVEDAAIEARLAALSQHGHEASSALASDPHADALSSVVVIEADETSAGDGDEEPVTAQELEALRAQLEGLRQVPGSR